MSFASSFLSSMRKFSLSPNSSWNLLLLTQVIGPSMLSPPNSNTCYRPSLSNIEPPRDEIESPIGVDNIQLDEEDQNSGGKKVVAHS